MGVSHVRCIFWEPESITRLLGMEAPTELCYQKQCRRIQAHVVTSESGGNAGDRGGEDDNVGMAILCSASAVRYRVLPE